MNLLAQIGLNGNNNGFARAMVISKLNGKIVHKVKGIEVKVEPVKGNCSA